MRAGSENMLRHTWIRFNALWQSTTFQVLLLNRRGKWPTPTDKIYYKTKKKVRTKGFLLGGFYWDRRSLLSDAPKEVNPEACGLRPVTNGV